MLTHHEMALKILSIFDDRVAEKLSRNGEDGGLKTDHLIKLGQIHATLALAEAIQKPGIDETAEKLLKGMEISEEPEDNATPAA